MALWAVEEPFLALCKPDSQTQRSSLGGGLRSASSLVQCGGTQEGNGSSSQLSCCGLGGGGAAAILSQNVSLLNSQPDKAALVQAKSAAVAERLLRVETLLENILKDSQQQEEALSAATDSAACLSDSLFEKSPDAPCLLVADSSAASPKNSSLLQSPLCRDQGEAAEASAALSREEGDISDGTSQDTVVLDLRSSNSSSTNPTNNNSDLHNNCPRRSGEEQQQPLFSEELQQDMVDAVEMAFCSTSSSAIDAAAAAAASPEEAEEAPSSRPSRLKDKLAAPPFSVSSSTSCPAVQPRSSTTPNAESGPPPPPQQHPQQPHHHPQQPHHHQDAAENREQQSAWPQDLTAAELQDVDEALDFSASQSAALELLSTRCASSAVSSFGSGSGADVPSAAAFSSALRSRPGGSAWSSSAPARSCLGNGVALEGGTRPMPMPRPKCFSADAAPSETLPNAEKTPRAFVGDSAGTASSSTFVQQQHQQQQQQQPAVSKQALAAADLARAERELRLLDQRVTEAFEEASEDDFVF